MKQYPPEKFGEVIAKTKMVRELLDELGHVLYELDGQIDSEPADKAVKAAVEALGQLTASVTYLASGAWQAGCRCNGRPAYRAVGEAAPGRPILVGPDGRCGVFEPLAGV
jgi:hypothetical protein